MRVNQCDDDEPNCYREQQYEIQRHSSFLTHEVKVYRSQAAGKLLNQSPMVSGRAVRLDLVPEHQMGDPTGFGIFHDAVDRRICRHLNQRRL